MPHILLRFMAIEDTKKLKLSRRVASVWVVISMSVAVSIGIIGYAMSAEGVIPNLKDSETIIVQIAHVLSTHGIIFAIIAGVILAGILASTMSTSDSQLLAASSSVSENLLEGVLSLNLSAGVKIVVARGSVIIISIIAMFLASNPNSSVFQIVSFAWAASVPHSACNALCIILEAFKQIRCNQRNGSRWNHGIRMEILSSSNGWRTWNL